MKTELKTNIFIKGFDTEEAFRNKLYGTKGIRRSIELIYQGKTDEIPEELAKEICYKRPHVNTYLKYNGSGHFFTAKESIQSAVTETTGHVYPFIIIYKNKKS
jgi:hypothetical protein